MKIKIDENGTLWLERAPEKMVRQECPRNHDYYCGDWCPLFHTNDNSVNLHCAPTGLGILALEGETIINEREAQ